MQLFCCSGTYEESQTKVLRNLEIIRMKHLHFFIRLTVCLVLVFNIIPLKVLAQDNQSHILEYCASQEDLKNNHWTEIEGIESNAVVYDAHDGLLTDELKDKAIKKLINKQAIAIKCDSIIMLNLRFLRYGLAGSFGKGYARAYPLKDGRYVMTYYDVKKAGGVAALGFQGGAMGAAMMSGSLENIRNSNVCYLYVPDADYKVVRVKNEVLKELLAGHEDLYEEYDKMGRYERNYECVIMPLLRRAEIFK